MSSGKASLLHHASALLTPVRLDIRGEIATFASGCFWGTEHMFQKYYKDKGIISTTVGYTGGKPDVKNPGYKEVCSGETDHAEAVRIEFDPSRVGYAELVGELCLIPQ
jgi:methionine-S-sulfoxide reductase